MNRTVEPSLNLLVPALNAQLPPQLVELAASLLAQSRDRVSTLKSEEELARAYACANLACERLKTSLDLPPIVVRPPVAPRIYKRLYTHLDKVLSGTPRTPAKPPNKHLLAATSLTSSRQSQYSGTATLTPISRGSSISGITGRAARTIAAGNRTPTKSTGRTAQLVHLGVGLPPWVHPTIRYICNEAAAVASKADATSSKTLSANAHRLLAPTILAGMEHIAAPRGHRSTDPWIMENLASLVVTMTLLARTRQAVMRYGCAPPTEAEVRTATCDILAALDKARAGAVKTAAGLDDEDAWEGYEPTTQEKVEVAVAKVLAKGWHRADWYEALDDLSGMTKAKMKMTVHERQDEWVPFVVGRADSMCGPQWAVLSEEKDEEFRLWKEHILRRIEQLEESGAMDVEVED